MEPFYAVVQSRAEVRRRRSFRPDEIALEQIVAGRLSQKPFDTNVWH